jgi:hypothetical protein
MKSPLTDKMFGLSLQKVQEEVSKALQTVSVNVRLNECSAKASTCDELRSKFSDFHQVA